LKKFFILVAGICSALVCYAQVVDDFSDGDYTGNPVWTPDNPANWTVVSNQLRSNSATQNSSFYITTPSNTALNAQWEFFVLLQFNTSSANLVDVYLMSDQSNLLSASNNGYFVRIGGTPDEISLYKITNGTTAILINGTDGVTNRTNNPLRIKVIRDENNNWSLQRDANGGTNYVLEGTVADNSFSTSNYFGIRVLQSTTSFFNRHFFDDIYAGPVITDSEPPVLQTVQVVSSTQLTLTFNEALEAGSAADVLNYEVDNGIGNPTSAVLESDNKSVKLTFANAFLNGITHTLQLAGVKDVAGNAMPVTSTTFLFFEPQPVNRKDILITELMADPSPPVGLPEAEFVEIHNRSANPVSLAGWKFSDGTSTATLPSHIIPPGQYRILCTTANVAAFSSFGTVVGVSGFPTLNNAGEPLVLRGAQNQLIDSIHYTLDWYKDADKRDGGWTLELIDPDNICADIENWKASVDVKGGTPGVVNSVNASNPDVTGPKLVSAKSTVANEVILDFDEKLEASLANGQFAIDPSIGITSRAFTSLALKQIKLTLNQNLEPRKQYQITVSQLRDCPGNLMEEATLPFFYFEPLPVNAKDIIITEIMADPSPVVGLPDAEFIELFNRSENPVTLEGWKFTDGSSTAILPSQIIWPGEYWIVCSNANTSAFSLLGKTIGVSNFPTLNNSGESIVLKTAGDQVMDSLYYNLNWYKDENKREGGWTLEIVDLNNTCAEEENWRASIDEKGGTPGKVNSVNANAPDVTGPKLLSASASVANEVILSFNEKLETSLSSAQAVIAPTIGVAAMTFTSPALKQIRLTLAQNLEPRKIYQITVSQLRDCAGNLMDAATLPFYYFEPLPVKAKDIIITEIMADPTPPVGLPEAEFIELYNRSENPVTLEGWKFTDGSSTATLPAVILWPGEYRIICPASSASPFSNLGATTGAANFPSLSNTGESIMLRDGANNLIDSVNYSIDWYKDTEKRDGGWTLELIDLNNICGEGENWIASTDAKGGTPGKVNSVNANKPDVTGPRLLSVITLHESELLLTFDEKIERNLADVQFIIKPTIQIIHAAFVSPALREVKLKLFQNLQPKTLYTLEVKQLRDCTGNPILTGFDKAQFALPEPARAGDLLINEVLFNPRPGGVDFVEVVNVSDKYINLKGWSLANRPDGVIINNRVITMQNFMVPPGAYRIFTSNRDVLKNYHANAVDEAIIVCPLPSMNDDAGSVAIVDDAGQEVDYFLYEANFHSKLLRDKEGVSLERISFAQPTNSSANWKSANANVGFATPGFINSNTRPENLIDENAVVIAPEIFSPSLPGQDFAQINYRFDQSGLSANVRIMDQQGRMIREIANNETLGFDGFFRWDGDRDDGSKARMGYYFVWFEVFGLDGMVSTFRKRVVVGR
jgi:hypothetical protein